MIIFGTGHRPHKLGGEWNMDGPISARITKAISLHLAKIQMACILSGPETRLRVISGGALGFDILLARAAVMLQIPVTLAIPHEGQDAKWNDEGKRIYAKMLAHPLVTPKIICPGPIKSYAAACIVRDHWMVDNAHQGVCLWDREAVDSGTGYTVKYARGKGVEVHELPFKELVCG
jgi:uncharacterized phage-like protein YoqJ